jgi:hypothetical protein
MQDNGDNDSDSSSDEEVAIVMMLVPYVKSRFATEVRHDSILQGNAYFKELYHSRSESRFYDSARMRRVTFDALVHALEEKGLHSSSCISSCEKVMTMLYILTGQSIRSTCERWQHSGSTISHIVNEVLSASRALQDQVIQAPSSEVPSTVLSSPKFYPYFCDCIGALDGNVRIPHIIGSRRSIRH